MALVAAPGCPRLFPPSLGSRGRPRPSRTPLREAFQPVTARGFHSQNFLGDESSVRFPHFPRPLRGRLHGGHGGPPYAPILQNL